MTVVDTRFGKVKAQEQDGILAFKGIPYAAPPMGELRWQPPQDPWPWAGVIDGSEYGKWAPQNHADMVAIMGVELGEQAEACLSLNVWTPAADFANRPVLVWIHGGGFTFGASSQGVYEGRELSRHGDVVVVSINYRLGLLGFANLNEATGGRIPATGNEGLLDQVKALEWVQDNIELFGGNPDNVTIFGESAGGMSVGTLFALPAAQGLFHKAIPQSGACHTVSTKATGTLVGEAIMKSTELDAQGLMAASFDDLLRVQRHIEGGKVEGFPLSTISALPFKPVIDGKVLSELPIEAVRKGGVAQVPVMTGSTLDEWQLFGVFEPAITSLDEDAMLERLGCLIDSAYVPGLVSAYRDALAKRGVEPTPPQIFMAIQTDRIFRMPALRLLEAQRAHNNQVYSYLFDWQSPAAKGALKSCHAIELAYVFGTYKKRGAAKFYGEGPAADALAKHTMDAWVAFARDGNPGWGVYDKADRVTHIFGENSRTEKKPFEIERQAWNEVPDVFLGSF